MKINRLTYKYFGQNANSKNFGTSVLRNLGTPVPQYSGTSEPQSFSNSYKPGH